MDYKKVLMEAVNAVLPPACPMCGKPAPFVGGIRAGITPRERYVTKALMKVRDGMKVHPIDN